MRVEKELSSYTTDRDSIVTIGMFDGVHLGHRTLINELRSQAGQLGFATVAITFRQLPEDYTLTKAKMPFLTEIETRVKLLQDEGVDIVIPLTFTTELANLPARSFIELLRKHLKMRGLVIGFDFALGKDREGNKERLQQLGTDIGFSVTVVPPLVINGETVSSTGIRKAMAEGDMEKVYRMSGRYFSLHGTVVSGAGRGEGLGFPTANLHVSPGQAIPSDGVYAGIAHVNGDTYPTMTNIGNNPTFGHNKRTIESFLLDYHGDLYGHNLTVNFITRLRKEIKFSSAEELHKQIELDVERGRSLLSSIELKCYDDKH